MAALDDGEREELLARRLIERVTEAADQAIRRRYLWVNITAASAFAAVTVLGGFSLITTHVRAKVEEAVTRQSDELNRLNSEIARWEAAARERHAQIDDAVAATSAQLDDITDKIEELQRVSATLDANLVRLTGTTGTVAQNAEDIVSLRAALGELTTLGGAISQLQAVVADLAADALALAAQVGGFTPTAATVARLTETRELLARPVVFVHFSGAVDRPVIQSIGQGLKDIGYRVPGEERIASSAREVRFFHAADAVLAQTVADDTNQLLRQQGFDGIRVQAIDLTGWPRAKPPVGTVELWLGNMPDVKG